MTKEKEPSTNKVVDSGTISPFGKYVFLAAPGGIPVTEHTAAASPAANSIEDKTKAATIDPKAGAGSPDAKTNTGTANSSATNQYALMPPPALAPLVLPGAAPSNPTTEGGFDFKREFLRDNTGQPTDITARKAAALTASGLMAPSARAASVTQKGSDTSTSKKPIIELQDDSCYCHIA